MERPILFNTAMVEAILEGRKTQTRRLVKQSLLQHSIEEDGELWIEDENGDYWRAEEYAPVHPGDKLYVRETWKRAMRKFDIFPTQTYYLYKAGEQKKDPLLIAESKWRPSIHMPKTAARIWLRVKDVRCERLWAITKKGVKAEGTRIPDWIMDDDYKMARYFFWRNVWDPTVKKRMDKWAANPWVWVIEFERIEGNAP